MTIYLTRHCDAVHPIEDAERPLSAHGRDQAQRLAAYLRRVLAERQPVAEVVHSRVLRARQTAEILAAAIGCEDRLRQAHGLTPGDSAEDAAEVLRHDDRDLVVVTHLPLVGRLAALLLGREHGPDPLVFRTGTMAALSGGGPHWALEWMVHPAVLPAPPRA